MPARCAPDAAEDHRPVRRVLRLQPPRPRCRRSRRDPRGGVRILGFDASRVVLPSLARCASGTHPCSGGRPRRVLEAIPGRQHEVVLGFDASRVVICCHPWRAVHSHPAGSGTHPCSGGRPRRVLEAIPGRQHEVGHPQAVDLVAVAIGLDRIGHLVGAERVLLILGGEVDRRIDRQLAQLVGRRDALRCMVGANGLDEHLRERLSFVGQVMVRERAGLIGIIEPDQPPRGPAAIGRER